MSNKKVALKKEGSKLYFEFSDGKKVVYDYKDKSYISTVGNNVTASTMKGYLKGLCIENIDEEKSDEKYLKLLKYIAKYNENGRYTLGGILELANTHQYLMVERFLIMGVEIPAHIKFYEHECLNIPKNIFKYLKKYFDNRLSSSYILSSLNKDLNHRLFLHLFEDLGYEHNKEDMGQFMRGIDYRTHKIKKLVENHNYNLKSLCEYLFNIYMREGVGILTCIDTLYDEADMRSFMSRNGKFEKYPKYILSTHHVTSRNYNAFKNTYDLEIFKKRMTGELEHKGKEYSIIEPKEPQDILNEGMNLKHCVASYVDRVLDGRCSIVFLRNNKDLNESLVTVEIKDNTVVQYKGEYNRGLSQAEFHFLNQYAKAKGLKII